MRGKAHGSVCHLRHHRITPAYAGKSLKRRMCQFGCQDHPRLCGEKRRFDRGFQRRLGSPPPMRGKAAEIMAEHDAEGITPAYAGKSQRQVRCSYLPSDHPRLCGEKTKKIPKQRYFFHQPASFSFSLQYT